MAKFRFAPKARTELLQQIAYYASIRPELGIRFEAAVADAVRRAAQQPKHGAPRTRSARRRQVKGFPFGVIYKEEGEAILVVAIADRRRPPEYWLERLK